MILSQNSGTNRARLVGLSFLMLFVELVLIRWLGSNVVYLSYFSNFVLLGSFLGIGVGFLRARSKTNLFPWAATALAALVAYVFVFPVRIDRSGSDLIYFGGTLTADGLPMWLTLPAIFLMVAIVMAAIAQGVARTFVLFEPLEAYRLDILGSLAGIAAFSLLSFSGAPPLAWGLVVAAAFLALYGRSVRLIHVVALAGMAILLGHESFTPGDSWSPYYKVTVFGTNVPGIKGLNVNGIPHQIVESTDERRVREPLYFLPYQRSKSNRLRNVLIVGAGNGSDVAIALASGAKHVDAVEIDPRIYEIGKQINPNHPYADPRVTIHINDGRAFLQQTRNRYDLILFALPDSLILVSGQSSLRLESYLFTLEAMQAARAHLAPHGAFGMYNYYRERWLVDRFANAMQVAFGHAPCVDNDQTYGRFALLMVSQQPADVTCSQRWSLGARVDPEPSTDDYPFPYLKTPSLPALYLITILAILLVSVLVVRTMVGSLSGMGECVDLFFMGAAFLLLETKNVVQFALLFGTTWFVNALVFFGILLSVYAAIEVAKRVRTPDPTRLYAALFAAILLAWLVPPGALLAFDLPLRFCAAVVIAFLPIFLANLVFADRFRATASSTVAFGANLLGAMIGGLLEYLSLLWGYRSLLVIVALLYALAFVFGRRHLLRRASA